PRESPAVSPLVVPVATPRLAAAEPAAEPQLPWPALLVLLWGGGAVAWAALALVRTWRFGRLLRFARPAPEALRQEAEALARQLGIGRCPGVWLVPRPVVPMPR